MWVWTPRIYFYIHLYLKVLISIEFSLLEVLQIFVCLFPIILHSNSFHCGISTHTLFLFVRLLHSSPLALSVSCYCTF